MYVWKTFLLFHKSKVDKTLYNFDGNLHANVPKYDR